MTDTEKWRRKIRRRGGDEVSVGKFCVRLSQYSDEEQMAKYRETKRVHALSQEQRNPEGHPMTL